MSLNNVGAITMFVEDVERSKAFYERVFAQPMIHEDGNAVAFKFENTIINLLKNPAARDLIKPATPGTSDGGSRFQLTVEVDDADAVCRELTSRGVTLLN
jgi:lactoylglutathione lyase